MEFTFASAFSAEGMLGHSSYVLLIISMMMRRMVWLRLFVIASALAGIAYATLILTDPVSSFWETLLIAVNIGQLARIWWLDRTTQFQEREAEFRNAHFANLSPSRFRTLIDAGEWMHLEKGDFLSREGTPVPALVYLQTGSAIVLVAGNPVARCEAGTFVGEMTVSTAEPANASVYLESGAEVWRVEAARLRSLSERHPEIREALEAAFFRTLRVRVIARNIRDAALMKTALERRTATPDSQAEHMVTERQPAS